MTLKRHSSDIHAGEGCEGLALDYRVQLGSEVGKDPECHNVSVSPTWKEFMNLFICCSDDSVVKVHASLL